MKTRVWTKFGLMMLIYTVILIVLGIMVKSVVGQTVTATEGPALRPLPQVIQNMSDEEYAAWAIWHNIVTTRKAAEYIGPSRYLYGKATDTYSRSNGRTTANSSSHSDSRTNRGKTTSNRSSSRYGHTSIDSNHSGSSHTRNYQYRYFNPNYAGSNSATYYNPFVRSKGSLGYPDYENIYLPTPEGVQSVADLMFTPSKKARSKKGITSEEAVRLIEKYGHTWYDHVDEIGL
jgi:hypothetical protein